MIPEQAGPLGSSERLLKTRPRVVLADDDTDTRELLAEALVNEGYLVSEARDGYELLALLAASVTRAPGYIAFDAIVTDVMMPGFSGLDVLTAVRRHLEGVPVVVVTAFGNAHLSRVVGALGAVVVVEKPFEIGELHDALANAIASAKERRSSSELPG